MFQQTSGKLAASFWSVNLLQHCVHVSDSFVKMLSSFCVLAVVSNYFGSSDYFISIPIYNLKSTSLIYIIPDVLYDNNSNCHIKQIAITN